MVEVKKIKKNKQHKHLADQDLAGMALRFKALSEPSRLKILSRLMHGPLNVGELVIATGLTQPNVSRHLSILSNVGLISQKKFGVSVQYSIADSSLKQICKLVCNQLKN